MICFVTCDVCNNRLKSSLSSDENTLREPSSPFDDEVVCFKIQTIPKSKKKTNKHNISNFQSAAKINSNKFKMAVP